MLLEASFHQDSGFASDTFLPITILHDNVRLQPAYSEASLGAIPAVVVRIYAALRNSTG